MSDANPSFEHSAADRTLLTALRDGGSDAVVRLEHQFGHELQLFCQRMLGNAAAAEDVVQDVLTRCCQLSQEHAPDRSVRGWIYQLARNRCIDVLRKRRERSLPGQKGEDDSAGPGLMAIDPCTTPSGKALKRERVVRILGCLDELDDELRAIIVMRYFQDLPRAEIAEAMDLTERAVKSRLAKAMVELRRRLGNLGDSALQ